MEKVSIDPSVNYMLMNYKSGLYLFVQDDNPNAGAWLIQWARSGDTVSPSFQFKFVLQNDGSYRIQSQLSNLYVTCMDQNAGSFLHAEGAGTGYQTWNLSYEPYDKTQKVIILTINNNISGQVMNISGNQWGPGYNVQTWGISTTNASERWVLVPVIPTLS